MNNIYQFRNFSGSFILIKGPWTTNIFKFYCHLFGNISIHTLHLFKALRLFISKKKIQVLCLFAALRIFRTGRTICYGLYENSNQACYLHITSPVCKISNLKNNNTALLNEKLFFLPKEIWSSRQGSVEAAAIFNIVYEYLIRASKILEVRGHRYKLK